MSNFTKGPYLRILEPRTTNGVNLKYDDNGNIMYTEQHAPLSARKDFESRNAQLPKHLRLIIETVGLPKGASEQEKRGFRPQRTTRSNPQPTTATNNKNNKAASINDEL